MKILHVLRDDKFIDMAIREFEASAPGRHEFIMVNQSTPYRYVASPNIRPMTTRAFVRRAHGTEVAAIVFHSLPPDRYRLLQKMPDHVKVFWIGWGFDYYNPLLVGAFPDGLILPGTQELDRPSLARKLVRVALTVSKRVLYPSADASLARVDYFSPVIDSEYDLALKHNQWFRPTYVSWNYGTVEDDLSVPGEKTEVVGRNLLVGNSAKATNNHYEIFVKIREQCDLTDRRVIVPLNYGNSTYRRKVLRIGKEILGDSFTPLIDFMPRDEYIATLRSCGFVMMNHLRQQALGNICICALLGARIYLNSLNPLYGWLQKKGMFIGDVDKLNAEPLSDDERRVNVRAILAHWGRIPQRERTRRLVEIALSAGG